MTPITTCWNDFGFLSLNQHVRIEFEGQEYPTLRHALEATKTPHVEERAVLANKWPWETLQWGLDKPAEHDEWWEYWVEKIEDWTLALVAQKFGMLHSTSDYGDKLKYGYWLACTLERPIIMAGIGCDQLFGTCYCVKHCRDAKRDAVGTGHNLAGQCMEVVRRKILADYDGDDLFSRDCDWCFNKKKHSLITPGVSVLLYRQLGRLTRRVTCERHRHATVQDAKHHADRHEFYVYPIDTCPAGGDTDMSFFHDPVLALPGSACSAHSAAHSTHNTGHSTTYTPPPKPNWGVMRVQPNGRHTYSVFEAI